MKTCAKRLRIPVVSLFLAGCVLLPAHRSVKAGNPHGAYYSSDHDKIFWVRLNVMDIEVEGAEAEGIEEPVPIVAEAIEG